MLGKGTEEVSLPLFSCRCFGYEVPVQAEDQRVWDLSCLNVQGIFSVDLKKFLDFFKLHTLFFFSPYLFPCVPGLKNCAFRKRTMAVSYKKKKGSEIRFPAQCNVAWPAFAC